MDEASSPQCRTCSPAVAPLLLLISPFVSCCGPAVTTLLAGCSELLSLSLSLEPLGSLQCPSGLSPWGRLCPALVRALQSCPPPLGSGTSSTGSCTSLLFIRSSQPVPSLPPANFFLICTFLFLGICVFGVSLLLLNCNRCTLKINASN